MTEGLRSERLGYSREFGEKRKLPAELPAGSSTEGAALRRVIKLRVVRRQARQRKQCGRSCRIAFRYVSAETLSLESPFSMVFCSDFDEILSEFRRYFRKC